MSVRSPLSLAVLLFLVAVSAGTPREASAQIPWDAPPAINPASPLGASVFLLRSSADRLGVLATYRHAAGGATVGYRLAVTEEIGPEEVAVAGGLDVSGYLARGIENVEAHVAWWSGVGFGHGVETVASLPLGFLVGMTGRADTGVVFHPYAGAHVALDFASGTEDEFSFGGAVDFGLDVVLRTGWTIRGMATVGDRDALAVGFRIPG